MTFFVRGALAAATLVAALAVGPTPGEAGGSNSFSQPVWGRIYAITPRCRDHPDYPVIGRVGGYIPSSARSRVSWTGCFPSMAECEAWRYIARGQIAPPIVFNRCEARF